jgi:hypothetical protein
MYDIRAIVSYDGWAAAAANNYRVVRMLMYADGC